MEGLAATRKARTLATAPVQPAFFPIIVGDWVIAAGPRSVAAYDLLTAQRTGHFDLQTLPEAKDFGNRPMLATDMTYTVTVDEKSSNSPRRVYARLGTGANATTDNQEGRGDSFLVCLDFSPQTDGQFHVRWHHIASATDGNDKDSFAYWEGAPVVTDEQVFIARTRLDKNAGTTSVDCYDADNGRLRWRREICTPAPSEPEPPPMPRLPSEPRPLGSRILRPRHHLLTLAGSNLLYGSDAGVIVALDAATGRRAWALRYPNRGLKTENGDPSPRGLTPAIYDSGRVFATPADYDGIFCLDSHTGEKLWERKGTEIVHMLGIAKGKLIVTTAKTKMWPAGIRALEAESGADIRRWIQPGDDTSLLSYGRGFLVGEWVFWPTIRNTDDGPQKEVLVLNQEDGQPAIDAPPFWQIHAGNMAFGNGCLAVADDENLYVYIPPVRLLAR
jgi:outer membrane protein assembly factor BamB